MKGLLSLLFFLLFISCSNDNHSDLINKVDIDTILLKSQNRLDTAAYINHKSDSITKELVIKVVKEMKFLTNEVDRYKMVNLLMNQNVMTERVVYKIDTVYIETRRNFWGREKTSTSIKSDSIVDEKTDTSINNSIKIDTTSQIVNN